MHHRHIALLLLLFLLLHIPASSSATTDTISAGQELSTRDKLVSKNGRYALGFFEMGSNSSQNTRSCWYLGIWFNSIPKFTQAWVANRDDPIKNPTSVVLKISQDGNLIIFNESDGTTLWSTNKINRTTLRNNNTVAMLRDNGNFVLADASNSTNIFWQSFDYPTDSFFPGAKFGLNKVTGLNRRFVSRKNSISLASGVYREELDPSGINQFVLSFLNSTTPYWTSGVWKDDGYFASIPDYSRPAPNSSKIFVDNAQEKYFMYEVPPNIVVHHFLDVFGQLKANVWYEGSQDWMLMYSQPRALCDVYATCGPFTTCNDDTIPQCTCVKGFTVRSPEDWEIDDRTGGCVRNTPLDCITNGSTDKFYQMSCVSLTQTPHNYTIETARSIGECSRVCLSNCTCTAYSFTKSTCSLFFGELLNIRQKQCSDSTISNEETLYLRLATKDVQSAGKHRRGIGTIVAIGVSATVLGLLALGMLMMIGRNKRKNLHLIANKGQGCNGIIAFGYVDLQRATKNFSQKLGAGGFGSVFKGFLNDSTAIAVKRLDFAAQGEKQFRAEVSSIGLIQHINLVKLIGFCCEGAKRLLVYEHMPNGSLDVHLFQSQATVLKWSTRYQIALGIARGLAYLHENCHDCIIHCDIKPENILLDDSFFPKIADFGMAKFLRRDFSRVITTMRGTIGYLAPEWISGVAITPKVDVYSYGMVLLEILSGRRNTSIPCSCASNHDVYWPVHVARTILEGDIMSLLDKRFDGDVDFHEAEIAFKIACWCIQDHESDRPTMGEIVQVLEGQLEINVPPMPRLLQAIAGSSNSACS